jgi:acyl-CoA synthetase (AMP-forming)/AMP-acid ligase II
MNIFDILRQHAMRLPQQAATRSSRHRLTTWRKLWSRVERATARLQGEWLVEPGDVVIYAGRGHPDALVLWLSLARLSARMLPLESEALRAQASHFALQSGAALVLHDDELQLPALGDDISVQPLSAIISRPCDYRPEACPEQVKSVSLLVAQGADLQAFSIADLLDAPARVWSGSATEPLFEPARLQGQILPALVRGLTLELD